MKIKKAFKFRLRPTPEQSQKMYEFAGCTRFVWKKALGLNLARLSQKHSILYYQELDFWSKIWVTTHPSLRAYAKQSSPRKGKSGLAILMLVVTWDWIDLGPSPWPSVVIATATANEV